MLSPRKNDVFSPMVVPWLLHQVSAKWSSEGERRRQSGFMLRHGKKVILVMRSIKQIKPFKFNAL